MKSRTMKLLSVILVLAFVRIAPAASKDLNEKLWHAAFDGDFDGAKAAVDAGADVNYRGFGGFTPLLAAAKNGHLEVVKYLVEHGADIDKSDNNRRKTPLLAAAFEGHFEIVKYLVDKGANVNVQAINGWTPLHDAAWVANFEIVKYLVDHGADLHLRNEHNETALQTALRGKQNQDVIRQRQHRNIAPEDYQKVIDYIKSHGG